MLKVIATALVLFAVFIGAASYLYPQQSVPQPEVGVTGKARVLPKIKPQREPALPPDKAEIAAVIEETMRAHEAAQPIVEDEFLAEPVDSHFAEQTEPQVWEKVTKLEGVESADVHCRTYHCKVVVRGTAKPAIALDVPGLSYRGNADGGLTFLYNPDLAASE